MRLILALCLPLFLSTLPTLANAFSRADLLGQFSPSKHPDFTRVDAKYASRKGLRLRKDVLTAFKKMHAHAKKTGVTLQIKSATRSFYHQKSIWERKWHGDRLVNGINLAKSDMTDAKKAALILQYSSMPGTSRHHWGTDIDLNALNNTYFEQGKGLKVYQWLRHNAATYGFFQPYTSKAQGRTGYEEEKWHWSYAKTAQAMRADYNKRITHSLITGFAGSQTAKPLNVIQIYVNGIEQP